VRQLKAAAGGVIICAKYAQMMVNIGFKEMYQFARLAQVFGLEITGPRGE